MRYGYGFIFFLIAVALLDCGCFETADPAQQTRPLNTGAQTVARGNAQQGISLSQISESEDLDKLREEAKKMEHLLTVETLMKTWKDLAVADKEGKDLLSMRMVAGKLAEKGQEGLLPLVDIMSDDANTPRMKMYAAICLSENAVPELAEKLIPLTRTDKNTTTRACAAQVLGALTTPEAKQCLRELYNDDEHRIRLTAAICLLQQQDPEILSNIEKIWLDEKTNPRERVSIFLLLDDAYLEKHPAICEAVAVNTDFETFMRTRAVTMLGRSSEPGVISALEKAASSDPDENIRSIAKAGIAAVKERAGGVNSGTEKSDETVPAEPAS